MALMGSPRRPATTLTARAPKKATATHKRNERYFFISVEHCGESSARAQFPVLIQSSQHLRTGRFNVNLLFPNDCYPAFGTSPCSPRARGAFRGSYCTFIIWAQESAM